MERSIILSCTRSLSQSFKAKSSRKPAQRLLSLPVCNSRRPVIAAHRDSPSPSPYRCLHTTSTHQCPSKPPKSRDRGPKSEEETQTDFGNLDVLRNTAAPATGIDACTSNGFSLNNQMRISDSGVLLVGGEAFRWRPWLREDRKEGTVGQGGAGDDGIAETLRNAKGQWDVRNEAWGLLELVWPKPDLLIIGTGPRVHPVSPSVRTYLNNLGIRLEIQDTRNAAAQFNLLATERGVSQVAAALIPIGWKEGR